MQRLSKCHPGFLQRVRRTGNEAAPGSTAIRSRSEVAD